MKKAVCVALVTYSANGDILKPDKKLVAKHPLNKLARLQKFGFDFAEAHMNNSDRQTQRVKDKIESFTTNMYSAWNRPNCGYFDETTNKGGPDPSPDQRANGKLRNNSRNRREANQWMFDACGCELDGHSNCYEDMSANQHAFYIDSILNEMFCSDEDVESGSCSYLDSLTCEWVGDAAQAVRGKGGNGRLSDNPEKAVKQITGGLKKWAQRYINNCNGMRNGRLPVKRANNLLKRWTAAVTES